MLSQASVEQKVVLLASSASLGLFSVMMLCDPDAFMIDSSCQMSKMMSKKPQPANLSCGFQKLVLNKNVRLSSIKVSS